MRRIRLPESMTASTCPGTGASRPTPWWAVRPDRSGTNRVHRAGGGTGDLAGADSVERAPGDILEIHTPGAGGYGTP